MDNAMRFNGQRSMRHGFSMKNHIPRKTQKMLEKTKLNPLPRKLIQNSRKFRLPFGSVRNATLCSRYSAAYGRVVSSPHCRVLYTISSRVPLILLSFTKFLHFPLAIIFRAEAVKYTPWQTIMKKH